MTLIETVEVGSGGAASIDFTSIPQTGTDLLVVFSTRANRNAQTYLGVRFNGSLVAVYNAISLNGNGATVSSGSNPSSDSIPNIAGEGINFTASTFGNAQMYIPNYTSANYKSLSIESVTENNATTAYMTLNAGSWNNTSAITSISIFDAFSSTILQYSTASLYTITKGSGGATVS